MSQQQNKPYTPGYTAALQEIAHLARTTPERLVAEFKDLLPEMRLARLKQKFALLKLIPPNSQIVPKAVEKMTVFLIELNKTMEDATVDQTLQGITALQDDNAKLEALKKLFLNDQVIAGCMNYLNMVIKSRYHNKNEDNQEVFKSNLSAVGDAISHVATQGDYDPERKLVRDFMRLLFELFDLILIQVGQKPVYFPKKGAEEEQGLWDPKRGIFLGNGAHLPS